MRCTSYQARSPVVFTRLMPAKKKMRPTTNGTIEFILPRCRPPTPIKPIAPMMIPIIPRIVRMLPKVRFWFM